MSTPLQPGSWEADPNAVFLCRFGKPPHEVKLKSGSPPTQEGFTCPDIWQMSNNDVAIIGRDLTEVYRNQLPKGVFLGENERIVIIPGELLSSAKKDIPDA